MDANIFENYAKAGKILKDIFAALLVKPGDKIVDIADTIENEIVRKGAMPAFPANISINEIAAHYTPIPDDEITIKDGDLVKIDLGAHIDGYIADAAVTFCSNKNDMVVAVQNAVNAAVKLMKPGNKVSQISEAIESEIEAKGFRAVNNLTGHSLDKFTFHGPVPIPNVRNSMNYEFKVDDVFAIEPFATNGSGIVKDSGRTYIFSYLKDHNTRLPESRQVLNLAKKDFSSLPFCERWIKGITPIKFDLAVKQLVAAGAIQPHPVLREAGRGLVAQAEHTVIVRDKPVVTTA
ncbi:MAG: type II methionyl aminopeptidase [Candidatus Aenigmarchaeota archaeon]|nr:type II methionyl aminopeptidase [Candidatus Aenigmarchaeota archaeon]